MRVAIHVAPDTGDSVEAIRATTHELRLCAASIAARFLAKSPGRARFEVTRCTSQPKLSEARS